MRRSVTLAALACAAFAVTAFGLGRIAPHPEMGDLDDKLRFFETHREAYDTLFFGSSRVLRGVVPEVFDAEMARRGRPGRSFNFGIDGMEGHETVALVRRVLAKGRGRPSLLRRVVVELPTAGGLGAEIQPENRFKARMVFWHDPEEARAAARGALGKGVGGWGAAADHALHGLAHATAAGGGRTLLRQVRERFGTVPGSLGRPLDPAELARSGGFEPFSQASYGTPSTHPVRRRFLRRIPEYRRAVAALAGTGAAAGRPAANESQGEIAALEHLVSRLTAAVRRAGAEPVFLVTPTVRPAPELRALVAAGGTPTLVAFDDPASYPELFAVQNRFDADHLTTDGARRFSRLLAERLAGSPEPDEDHLLAERR
jgi:hypothetical protein